MTVVADKNNAVPLPMGKPGDQFDLQIAGAGKFVLTLLGDGQSAQCPKVTIQQRDGFSVGALGRPIDSSALAEALREFP